MNICQMLGHLWKDMLYKNVNGNLYHIYQCERCGEVRQEATKIVLGMKNIQKEINNGHR